MQQQSQDLDRLAQAVKEDPTDSALFVALVCASEPLIRRIVDSFVRADDFRYEDLEGEMKIALLRAAKAYDPAKGSFRAFANTCMNRCACSYFRKHKKEDPVNPLGDEISELSSGEDIEADLADREAVENLLAKTREFLSAFEYRVLEMNFAGFSNPEIALRLGVDKKSVENAKNRIKGKAKKHGIGLSAV